MVEMVREEIAELTKSIDEKGEALKVITISNSSKSSPTLSGLLGNRNIRAVLNSQPVCSFAS